MQNIPNITRQLLIINVLAYFASMLMPSLSNMLGLHYWQANQFHLYQFITYMFMHGGFTHLFFNMFALWMFGCVMEQTWGSKRFLIYYFVCGLGAGLMQEIAQTCTLFLDLPTQGATIGTTVGASGSIYGILLAFGMTYPEERMFIFPLPVPIKAKWFVTGYIIIELFLALSNNRDGVAHVAHLGGMLFGFFLIRHWRREAKSQASNFRGWDSYSGSNYDKGGPTILSKIRNWFRIDRGNLESDDSTQSSHTSTSSHQQDWDYNEKRRQEEAEIDAILDKIRRSGYASLSAEEKRKLFEASKK